MANSGIHADIDYWNNLTWPAAPNQEDYAIFKQYCEGQVLLLGSTPLLLPLCSEAWDLNPKISDPRIRNLNWFDLDQYFDTVILDGGLAFGKQFTKKLLPIILKNCGRFVARAFLKPNWPTKYACYFPRAHEFDIPPQEHTVSEVYTFYIWNKNHQY